MTNDPTDGITLNYDPENRLNGASGYTYTYDGDGNRVKKSNGTTGTIYWYMTPGIVGESDLSGNLTSEYVFFNGERVARKSTNGVFYYFSDHLKTASVITDSAGVIKAESDYYPWGGELQFSNNDSNHYKFTGKERDSETGLDYFGARYYSGGLGRWVSADWSATPVPVPYARFDHPQTLNQYAYVGNNPISLEDPDGHGILDWLKKEACSIGISSACAPPPPPQQNKPQLVNAQDQARNNPALQPKGNTTHCNQATCQIVQQTGAPVAPLVDENGKPVSANQQAQNLANSNQYREVTPQEAQQIANNGGTVVVAYDNPNGHGHTATVRPEGVAGDNPPPGGKGPLINDIGKNVGVHNANYTFRNGSDVHYYTPKEK